MVCNDDAKNARIDSHLHALYPQYSRTYLQKIIKQGHVLVGDKTVRSGFRLSAGQEIKIFIPEPELCVTKPEAIPLEVVYEDPHLIVIDKPAGMVTHPAAGHPNHTLVNAVLHHCPELEGVGEVKRPGIVHRLDKDTSGLIVIAKNESTFKGLKSQWEKRTITREYYAVCLGPWAEEKIVVDAPIGRHPSLRKKMAVTALNSRSAITEFTLLENLGNFSLVKAELKTGRTHQIRVHLAYLNSAVVGDQLYAGSKLKKMFPRQALHARRLGFVHPQSGNPIDLISELPEDMSELLKKLHQI